METWLANMLYIWFLLFIVAVAILFWIGVEIREQRKLLLKDKPNNKEMEK
jgi:Na+/H+ antiporter NhaC